MRILKSPADRARRAMDKIQRTRDLCGKWPATLREVRDARWANPSRDWPRGGLKPSERARRHQAVMALLRDKAALAE
jgi:hypothetical protein